MAAFFRYLIICKKQRKDKLGGGLNYPPAIVSEAQSHVFIELPFYRIALSVFDPSSIRGENRACQTVEIEGLGGA